MNARQDVLTPGGRRQIDKRAPLSYAQEALWFLKQLYPRSAVYTESWAARIKGPVEAQVLERSLNELVRRHEILRTSFSMEEGRPVQVVIPTADVSLRLVDLGNINSKARESELERLTTAEAQHVFDLARAPLLRVLLVRSTETDSVLVFSMHHIVCDGIAADIFIAELQAIYTAYAAGWPSPLADLPLQFAEFAAEERRRNDELTQENLLYWKKSISDTGATELPADRPRPPVQTFRGASQTARVPDAVAAAVHKFTLRAGASPFMTVLGAFQILLHRYTGQTNIVIGSPITDRSSGVEGLIGVFVNSVVIRADFSGDPIAREALARVRDAAIEALAHRHTPFDRLVDVLRPHRDLSRNPLFQIAFAFEPRGASHQGSAAQWRAHSVEGRAAKFDMTMIVMEEADGFTLRVEYATDLFEAASIRQLIGHYLTLLEASVSQAETRISELPMLTESELHRLLVEWNSTDHPYRSESTLHSLFEEQARRNPDTVAVVDGEHHITYGEIDRQSDRLATHLEHLGVGPEMPVGVSLERSAEMVVAVLGILKAGGAYLPLDPAFPEERRSSLLGDAGAAALITTRSAGVPAGFTGVNIVLDGQLELAGLPTTETVRPFVAAENLACVFYTSGSTGVPKGVAVTHRGICRLISDPANAIGRDDRLAQLSPFGFDASSFEIWGALLHGARLVILGRNTILSTSALKEEFERRQVTVTFLTTALFHEIARLDPALLAGVSTVMVGGETADAAAFRRVLQAAPPSRLFHMYGPTEAVTFASRFLVEQIGEEQVSIPIGKPVANLRLYILDRHLSPSPAGVPGEMWVAGECFARGYLNRPDLTAERFVPDPLSVAPGAQMYRTGDRARYLPDGSIEFLGRLDDQVKLRGFRVEPGEIEAWLHRHSDVAEAAVIMRRKEGRQALVAYVAPLAGRLPEASELRSFLQSKLPDYMVPSIFVLLDQLPRNANGKVDRRALPEPEAPHYGGSEYTPPRTPTEQTLARIWAEVLGLPRIGIHDNFFASGGDSILSIRIVARANREGLRVTSQGIFQNQTIATLAAMCERASADEPAPAAGPAPLTPIQEWFFAGCSADWHHFNQAVCLELLRPLSSHHLARALDWIARQHGALRLRFAGESGRWSPIEALEDVSWPLEYIDLRGLDAANQEAAWLEHTVRIEGSLDPADGPVARAALFDMRPGRPARLLLVAHHLVVDAVSWQIILEDLETTCVSANRGLPAPVTTTTTSFQAWAHRLRQYADSPALRGEMGHWQSLESGGTLPIDHDYGEDNDASARKITVSLTPPETEALLREVPNAYRTQVPDAVLAALLIAMRNWTGSSELLIDVEGHGREPLFDDVDLSRTVGWFTSLFPVLLKLDSRASPADALPVVKEQMRAIPARGIGFGVLRYLCPDPEVRRTLGALPIPEISFNYLGQTDGVLRGSELFRLAAHDTGPQASPRQRRRHKLGVDALVSGGRLRFDWIFSANRYRPETVERLAREVLEGLRAIIRHCTAEGAGGFTGADFPLARLDRAALDRLWQLDRSIEDVYPLAPLQKGMLFHTLYAPGSGVYFEQLQFTLDGEIDYPALRRAWDHAALRHPILRTSFMWEGLEEPLQIVRSPSGVSWEEQDWRGLDSVAGEDRLRAFLRRDRERGFDLETAPPMRLALLRTRDRKHQMVWSFHHALLDGWSMSLVLRDVLDSYEAFRLNREPALEPALRWRDYITWLGNQDKAAEESFWREYLRAFLVPTPLPLAKALDDTRPETYGEAAVSLPEDVTARCDALLRRQHLTWNTVFQGAWAVQLSRYTGESDVVFGSTVSGRPAALRGVERIAGLFLNTAPVRLEVEPSREVAAWLEEVQVQLAEARQHQHISLVEAQAWSEVPSGTPLVESILVFENYPVDPVLRGAGESLRIVRTTPYEQTTYPLSIFAVPGKLLRISAVFDERRYDRDTIQRVLDHLIVLVEAMARHPERRIEELSLLTETQRRELLDWGSRAPPGSDLPRAHEMFEEQVRLRPEARAAEYNGAGITYDDLNRHSNQLARWLKSLGVGAEVRVGVCLERSPEMVVAVLAILKAGGAFVPLDPRYPAERSSFILEDAQVAVLVTQESLFDAFPTHWGPVVCVNSDHPQYEHLDATNLPRESEAANLAYVIYTSGSTGQPKGVLLTHGGLSNLVAVQIDAFACDKHSRVLEFASLNFDAAVSEIFVTLASGGTLVLASPDDIAPGEPLATCLQRESISLVTLPPSVLQTIPPDAQFPALRTIVSAGEACRSEMVKRWSPARRFLNAYGPTEITVCASIECDTDPTRSSIGRPIPGARLYVLDEHLHLQPTGVVGELCVGGAGVARGYANCPEATAAAFVPNPFSDVPGDRLFRTGDLGRWLSDGRIEFIGRRDGQVKLRGFRIELGEIEEALRRQPGVREAAVLVHDAESSNPRLVAYVVPQRDAAGHDRYRLPNGMRIAHLNKAETDLMYQEIFVDETFLSNGITFEDGDVVFDVGANIGLFTLFAATTRPDVKVFAFEPVPAVFQVLKENVAAYGVNARLFECGLSRTMGQARFTYYPLMSGMSGAYADAAEDEMTARAYMINQGLFAADQIDELIAGRFESRSLVCPMKTLSQVIREEGVERIDLLKIDVEKSELDVLEGIAEEDWERVRQIILEVHAIDGRLERVVDLMRANGFMVQAEQDARFQATNLFRISGIRDTRAGSVHRAHFESTPEDAGLSIEALRTALKHKLPEYMIPAEFVSIADIPRTTSGKLDRKALPAPESRESKRQPRVAAPPNPVEEILCGIWDEVLGRENSTTEDNFFQVGGHSLIATKVIVRVREALQVDVPLRILFEHPTVAALARFISSQRDPGPTSRRPVVRRDRTGDLPLSVGQQRLWFVQELEAGVSIYNCPFALEITGPLDRQALERTLNEVVMRHEILRTRFPTKDGSPVQLVEPSPAVPLVDIDPGEADVRAVLAEEIARPFDLRNGPVIRAGLVRQSVRRHLLLLVMHHIVCDGASLGVLLDEIAEFYEAFSSGRSPRLQELPIQYVDFAAWQRSSIEELAEAQLAYWRAALRGCPTEVRLPLDRPRPVRRTHAGSYWSALLPDELAGHLRELSRHHGVTLFMTLLAGFQTWLYHVSGQDDLAVGVVTAGRGQIEIERLIGFFLNMLVLRADLSGSPTFLELLERVRESALGAFAHQDVPFEKLVEEIQPDRSQGGEPLIQVAFGLDRPPQPGVKAGEVEMTLVEPEVTTARYDLTLWISDRADRLEAGWTFSTDLFDSETIERMHRQFEAVLSAAVSQPQASIADLEWRTADEVERYALEQQNREALKHRRLLNAVPKAVTATADSRD